MSVVRNTTEHVPLNILNDLLKTATDAAYKAGHHMKDSIGKQEAHAEKTKYSKDDLVTIVDKQCQTIIEDIIKINHPNHDVLGEEDVQPGPEAAIAALEKYINKDWLWIVDPIDGTTNFVHGRPNSVVSIAVAHKGNVVIGVIYDPYRDEMFKSQVGYGAFCNEKRIQVCHEENTSSSLVAFGIGCKPSVRIPMLRAVTEMAGKCRGIRVLGSAALDLAWVSCGRVSFFFELDLNAWDVAAGALIVKEAGGRVTDTFGENFSLRTRNIVASNGRGKIHDDMLECIKVTNAREVQSLNT